MPSKTERSTSDTTSWPPRGMMRDVPAHHETAPVDHGAEATSFDRGVGLEGYERRTGVSVPTHPSLVLPGHDGPLAEPFGAEEGETDEMPAAGTRAPARGRRNKRS